MSQNHTNKKSHAIIIPYPLQGHVIPSVHLATKLASIGFTITFINTNFIHHEITKANPTNQTDIFAEARDSGLDIRYATVSDGFPVGFDRSLNHDQFMEGVLHVLSAHVDELVGNLVNSSEPKVSIIISDTFFVWNSMIAKKYKLINVSFWTEPALVLNIYYHLDLLRSHGHFGSKENRKDTIDYIPGVETMQPKDLMSYLQPTIQDTSTVVHRIIFKAFEDIKHADYILINTVQELEKNTILTLNKNQPIFAIGPLFPIGPIDNKVATSMWVESDCTKWLDDKDIGCVLYISFGSYAHTSKDILQAIAHGLLASQVHFIWVIRPDIVSSADLDPLPDGFKEKIVGRGLVVTWCDQVKVLSHQAVGGFLTHCGWNSILESIWWSIPLLCFPLLTDQFTNRKLVVDDLKIGINLCDDEVVSEAEVAKNILRLMKGSMGEELRGGIRRVKNVLESAWEKDGSSQRNFDEFVRSVQL
ncbi:UDP-glycosyltransferase 86A1-like [Silene latifolia]|uniref:UDP-glycosyltransferase 86A1-like n=1 Tax=Silene latifolia TaxID=37657 RepID=UPI003D786CA0